MRELKKRSDNAPMLLILEYVGGPKNDPESFQLWACRGEKKGCKKRRLKTSRHCADCFLPNEDDTLEEVKAKMMRGDA